MFQLIKTLASDVVSAAAGKVRVFVNETGQLCLKASDGTVIVVGTGSGGSGSAGRGIASFSKTSTVGLVDTYTVTYTDATTSTLVVTNGAAGGAGAAGRGVSSIAKTGTAGLVDTYTITYSDSTTSTFTVTNGTAGSGGGSYTAETYTADVTAGRTITSADLGKTLPVNSASNLAFTIPNDTTLGLTGSESAFFRLYYKANGVGIVVHAVNTIQKYAGYPTPAQYVTETYTRVGANQWKAE